MAKHDFSKLNPYIQQEMTRYLKAIEQKRLFPEKLELEQLVLVIDKIMDQIKESGQKSLQIKLFEQRFTLNRKEQSTLKQVLNLNYQPLKIISDTFDIVEDIIKMGLRLEVYCGFMSKEGNLIPRSTTPTLILPFKGKHVTYNPFEDWKESVKNPRSLNDIIGDIKKNNDPVFEGRNVRDYIYVNYPKKTPLRATVIPLALDLYGERLVKVSSGHYHK